MSHTRTYRAQRASSPFYGVNPSTWWVDAYVGETRVKNSRKSVYEAYPGIFQCTCSRPRCKHVTAVRAAIVAERT